MRHITPAIGLGNEYRRTSFAWGCGINGMAKYVRLRFLFHRRTVPGTCEGRDTDAALESKVNGAGRWEMSDARSLVPSVLTGMSESP